MISEERLRKLADAAFKEAAKKVIARARAAGTPLICTNPPPDSEPPATKPPVKKAKRSR